MNSRDRRWDAESLAKVKAAWNGIDTGSGEFKEIACHLDKEGLGRAGIDTSTLPAVREAGDFDPMTGCNRQGQSAGLVQCLSIPGQPYFGCVVQAEGQEIRCIARRRHMWRREVESAREIEKEWVMIAGACYVQEKGYKPKISDFITTKKMPPPPRQRLRSLFWKAVDRGEGIIQTRDILLPSDTEWQITNIGNAIWGSGFRKLQDSPDFYYPDTLEYQMPPVGQSCGSGFAMCSPYLKVLVMGSSVLICMAAVRLYKEERREGGRRVYFNRERDDGMGWSCRLFYVHELTSIFKRN